MAFTFSSSNTNQTTSGPTSVTITVPANAAVGVLVNMDGGGSMGYFQGSVSDGANTYTAAGGANLNAILYVDSFYCLNTTGSASTLTYTPSASYISANLYSVFVSVWVWTVSGGTAVFGSQSNNGQSAPGTGTDAVTSGSVNCSTNSVIMGFSRDQQTAATLSAGTGFTQDYNAFLVLAEHGAFNSNHAATWTCSVGTDTPLASQALSFGFSTSGPGTSPRLPLLQLGVVTPLAWIIRRRQIRARELRQWKQDSSSGLILPDYKRVA